MALLQPGVSTALVITPKGLFTIGLPPYSARGLVQTIDPVAVGSTPRRTVNGKLVSLAPKQFEKYHSRITGNDQDPPAIDGVFPGAEITIECIAEIGVAGGSPNRPAAPGSVRTDGNFTFYRPILDMLVTTFSFNFDEWGATVGWTLDSEEV